jgi:glucokinase
MPVFSLPETGLYLGIDVGGTKCAVVIGDQFGKIYQRLEHPTNEGLQRWPEAGETIVAMVSDICALGDLDPGKLKSIGVSCGGPLNSRTGVILRPPNLPGWTDVNIRHFLSSRFPGVAVLVENDANATAIAEHRWGAGRGFNNLAYLTCGTGVGAGIILDGHIFRGKGDLAGEIGHAVILPDGPECLCGNRGCLEALASGGAIGRIGAKQFNRPDMTGKDVIELAKGGNIAAQEIVYQSAIYLGIGIANLLQTLDLEVVVLGSIAAYAGEIYLDTVRESARKNTWASIFDSTAIVMSGLGFGTQDFAALAVALPMVEIADFRE